MKELVSSNLIAEKAAFTFPSEGSEVIRKVPFVYFPNLMMVIGDLVEKHERYGKLVIGILIQTNFTWQRLSRIDMA